MVFTRDQLLAKRIGVDRISLESINAVESQQQMLRCRRIAGFDLREMRVASGVARNSGVSIRTLAPRSKGGAGFAIGRKRVHQ